MKALELAKAFPVRPEQFPDDSSVMTNNLRLTAFRIVSNRLLSGLVAVNELEAAPEGWRRLVCNKSVFKEQRNARLFSPDQRIVIATTVTSETFPELHHIVVSAIHRYGGDSDLPVTEDTGEERIEHNGQTTSLFVRGVLGGDGNPYFSREGTDCEPELQTLDLRSEGYPGATTTTAFDAGVQFDLPVPHDVTYAFFDKPPRGDETIIELTELTARFLEELAVGEAA